MWLKNQTVICLLWYAVVDQSPMNFSWQAQWRHQIGHSITKTIGTHVTFITAWFLLPLVIRRVWTCAHRELIREINNEDFFFLMFSNETFVCISCYNSFSDRQTHSWWLCHRKYIWWKVPGVSMAVRGHTTHRQSSTCWRWSPRTFAGLSARPLPPSAPPSPSGQKQSAMWVNILLKQCLLALLSPSLGSADCHKEK